MPTPQEILDNVKQFIQSVGVDPATCWNEQNKAYYVYKGSAKLEIFVSSHPNQDGSSRDFLRIFSGLMKVPASADAKFYRRLLEIGDQSLGVKLTVMSNATPDNDWVYATYERDTHGLDYNETVTCIADMGLWADNLDDKLKNEFGGGPGPARP
ncbi:MAG: YbjN domain-containing protein [Chitinophagales bacterium]|nr:YbjN domain-containing protein [Chitinophagales bacterium]